MVTFSKLALTPLKKGLKIIVYLKKYIYLKKCKLWGCFRNKMRFFKSTLKYFLGQNLFFFFFFILRKEETNLRYFFVNPLHANHNIPSNLY